LMRKRVCKPFFLNTLGINGRRYHYAASKKRSAANFSIADRRGQKVPVNKTPQDDIAFIKQHVESFPKYSSHYGNSNREYLSPNLNLNKMYELYKQKWNETFGRDQEQHLKPCSLWVYRRVFTTEYNLHFYQPKSDTCNRCDEHQTNLHAANSEEEKINTQEEWQGHLDKAEQARQHLKKVESGHAHQLLDVGDDNSVIGITFDMQKTLPTPYLNTSDVYYSCQLWTYNFGIHAFPHDLPGKAIMNMWHEGLAGRGSTEITSHLYAYYKSLPPHIKHVVTVSDGCGSQNRNYPMARFNMFAVNAMQNLESINMLFLESGHSYLPNDRDFGIIAKAMKHRETIYTPEDYQELIKSCKKKNPFEVKSDTEFVEFANLDNVLINRKKNENKEQVRWLKIRWLQFQKGSLKMKYKYSPLGDFLCVDMCIRRVGHEARNENSFIP
ncbi:MAG: hypothetical protein GY705_30240, partial [Bacteroidetes bacterium]|nr:hypothetical protein [Bacteroidota bacterium]